MLTMKHSLRRVAAEMPRVEPSILMLEADGHPQKLLRMLLCDSDYSVHKVSDCEVALADMSGAYGVATSEAERSHDTFSGDGL